MDSHQQDYISSYLEYLYPRRNQSTASNPIDIPDYHLSATHQFHSRPRNMQRILNPSEPSTLSLVDVVREKNFQSQHLNRFGSYQPSAITQTTHSRNQCISSSSGFDVNDPMSWNDECKLSIAAKLAQLPMSSGSDDFTLDNCDLGSFAMRKWDDNSDVQDSGCYVNGLLDSSSDSFSTNVSHSDTDYSYFVAPTNSSTTSNKSNEYSLFSDSSSSSSSGSSHSTNFRYLNNNYACEANSQPSNASNYEDSDTAQSQIDKQLEVMNCISSMSNEQLEQVMRMINETVTRNHVGPSAVHKEAADKVDFQPSLLLSSHNVRTHSTFRDDDVKRDSFTLPDSRARRVSQSADGSKDVLEIAARNHHSAAVRGNVEAPFTWNGELPKLTYDTPFSNKVFVGGLPYQITESQLVSAFRNFGNLVITWPGKEKEERFKGFVYVIFENELQVKFLLKSCRKCEGNLFFTLSLRNGKSKDVQIIPWSTLDSSHTSSTANPFMKLEASKTVYVGAIHGTMNARGLFRIMDDLFGGVIYAGICVDKYKYPTGSGRVIFDNHKSYVKAISAGFVSIRTAKFKKTVIIDAAFSLKTSKVRMRKREEICAGLKGVQLDPFMEESPCSICNIQMGPYFCRKNGCFRYFCSSCWTAYHKALRLPHDTPLKKNSKLGASVVSPTTYGFLNF